MSTEVSIKDEVLCALIKFSNMFVDNVLDTSVEYAAWIVGLLPSLPFEWEPIQWGGFGASVGYLVPVEDMARHFTAMLGIALMWYAVQQIMRFIKLIN